MSEAGCGTDQLVSLMAGSAALPRKNGELVFQAPWEGRAFGMAVSLYDSGRYDWDAFRQRLIDAIAAREAQGAAEPGAFPYYECWLEAFERLVLDQGLVSPEELAARTGEYESGARDEF